MEINPSLISKGKPTTKLRLVRKSKAFERNFNFSNYTQKLLHAKLAMLALFAFRVVKWILGQGWVF